MRAGRGSAGISEPLWQSSATRGPQAPPESRATRTSSSGDDLEPRVGERCVRAQVVREQPGGGTRVVERRVRALERTTDRVAARLQRARPIREVARGEPHGAEPGRRGQRHRVAGPFELGGNEPRIERQVVGDRYPTLKQRLQLACDLRERRGPVDVRGRQTVDLGRRHVTLRVHERLPLVDQVALVINEDDSDLEDAMVMCRREPGGLDVDDGVPTLSAGSRFPGGISRPSPAIRAPSASLRTPAIPLIPQAC